MNHWLNITAYGYDDGHNSSPTNTMSTESTTTASSNNQGSPNPRLWDMRWFFLLACPLLFTTIILPLILGPMIRYACRSYIALKNYWRLGFVLIMLIYIGSYYGLVLKSEKDYGADSDSNINDQLEVFSAFLAMLCDFGPTVFVSFQTFVAWQIKRHHWLWLSSWILIIGIWVLDIKVTFSGNVDILYGAFGWVIVWGTSWFTHRQDRARKERSSGQS